MGMYTQYRGFLCVKGLSSDENIKDLLDRFDALKVNFLSRTDIQRPWVCNDSHLHSGSNGSGWIFVGSEHKNYDSSMDEWISLLVKNFRCEGRIERHYEEREIGDHIDVLNINPMGIRVSQEITHQEGYGF